jgi:hypothetical protein
MRFSLIVPAALLALIPLGCGDSKPDPNDPSQANAYGGQQPGVYTPPAATYQQPPATTTPGTTTTPPATGLPGATPAASGSPATPIAAGAAAVVTPVLQGLSTSEIPTGMQPDGQAFAAQFQEGQVFEQTINIQPNKCYSVVAASVGVQELDIQLLFSAPPLPPQVLAQDQSTGPNATLGGKAAGCFKNPFPIGGPGKVVVKATRGAGLAAAQIYVK